MVGIDGEVDALHKSRTFVLVTAIANDACVLPRWTARDNVDSDSVKANHSCPRRNRFCAPTQHPHRSRSLGMHALIPTVITRTRFHH